MRITKKTFLIGFCLWTISAAIYAVYLSLGAHLSYLIALITSLISFYIMAVISIFVIGFCRRFRPENHKIGWFITIHLLTAHLFSAIYLFIDYFINWIFLGNLIFQDRPLDSVGVFQFFNGILMYALITGIFYTMDYYRQYRDKELKASQLETLTHQAELKALKSQVNPHFLFNTLNTIFALIDHNSRKAKDTVTKLSSLLRYSLAGIHQEFVTLEKEIDSIKIYLAIEKARFRSRLKVRYTIEPKALIMKVPPMLLQPLVENAVKHGISTSREGGTISISALIKNNVLTIRVEDNSQSKKIATRKQEDNNGIGLANLRQRLEKIYGNHFSLETGPIKKGGFSVLLHIDHIMDDA